MINRYPHTENSSSIPELSGVRFVQHGPDALAADVFAVRPLDFSLANPDGSKNTVHAYHVGYLEREIETVGGMQFPANPESSHKFPLFLIRGREPRRFSVLMVTSMTAVTEAMKRNHSVTDYALNSGGWDYRAKGEIVAQLNTFNILSGVFNYLVEPTWRRAAINKAREVCRMVPLPPEPFALPTSTLEYVAFAAAALDHYIESGGTQ